MSRFDRFSDGGPSLPAGHSNSVIPTGTGAKRLIDNARQATTSRIAHQIIGGQKVEVAIALDATGSMAGLIDSAKKSLGEIIRRSTSEAGCPIEIRLYAYRDYDVPNDLLQQSDLTSNPEELVRWLRGIRPLGGGGNSGEAVEAALEAISTAGNFKVVLIAGDEPSNSRSNLNSVGRRQSPTAIELAGKLGQAKVPVHTFVAGEDPRTLRDFRAIAEASGGKTGRLDGSREMIDMAVMAILAAIRGAAGVRTYMAKHELNQNALAYGQLLLGPSK
jgi:hypothetical protein